MINEELIDVLTKTINKKYKGESIAHLLGPAGDRAATNVKDWISTGSTLLDLAISNRRNGGIASGKVTELTGLEGSGKSLIGAHILASTQKMGGIAVYIDTESAVSIDFLKVIGVDVDKLIYIQLETVEKIYEVIEQIVLKIRESNKDKLVTILVDSMSMATTEIEENSDYGKDGWSTGKAIINSKAMRKITTSLIAKHRIALVLTNQLRTKLNVMFGDKYCVDPYSTKIKIRFNSALNVNNINANDVNAKSNNEWIEKELYVAEFSNKFLLNNDFTTPREEDISNLNIEIWGRDLKLKKDMYTPIKSFIVKPAAESYYTDGNLKGTAKHRIIENGKNIFLKDHPNFKKIKEKMYVVDFDIPKTHNYYANGRLNHNTTSGGLAIGFAASTRIRLTKALKIKDKSGEIIGLYIKAKITKSRFGPSYRTVEFPLYFTSGIDDNGSLLLYLKHKKLIKAAGAWYTIEMPDKNGEITNVKFQAKDWSSKLETIPGLRQYVLDLVSEDFIMKYEIKENSIDIDSLSIETDNEPEQEYEKLNSFKESD